MTVLRREVIEEELIAGGGGRVATTQWRRRGGMVGEILKAPDWIYHGAISTKDSSRGVLITAHNEVLPIHILGEGGGRLEFGRLRAPRASRPILYSAQVRWTGEGEDDEVLVAAGTVFGEIIVWRCRGILKEEEGESDEGVEVLFVFTGHEGSIFGVDISREITILLSDNNNNDDEEEEGIAQTKRMRLLASCSDDRTIRVWDITSATTSKENGDDDEKKFERTKKKQSRHNFAEARETGFGENIMSPSLDLEAEASVASSKPLAMAMGHVSRIWNVRFAPPTPTSEKEKGTESLVLYSFGEDASAQKWRLDLRGVGAALLQGGQQEEGVPSNAAAAAAAATALPLTHQGTMLRHSGKHIWSSAVFAAGDTRGETLVATGGSDGKINLIEDHLEGGYPGSVMLTMSGSEISNRFPLSVDSEPSIKPQVPTEELKPQQGQEEVTPNPTPTMTSGAAAITKKKTKKAQKEEREKEKPFQMYALLSSTSFLATTSTGRIFKGSLITGKGASADVEWAEVSLDRHIRNDLRQYQIVRGLPKAENGGKALLASTTGRLYLYDEDVVRQIYQMPGKIADVFPLPTDAISDLIPKYEPLGSNTGLVPIIVTTMGSPQIRRLLVLDLTTGADTPIRQEYTIEVDKGFIITAAGCCRGSLILGSRNGALMVYRPRTTGDQQQMLEFQQIARIERPFTKDAVSAIIPLPPDSKSSSSPCPYFLTTSRDGHYRIYELTTTNTTTSPDSQVEVHLRHEAVPPFGPVIEGAFFTTPTPTNPDSKPELILFGFRSQDFVVWNETRRTELAKVECGGAYRSFTTYVDEVDQRDITFVWTRATRTCVYSYFSASREMVQEEGKEGPKRRQANAAGITTLKYGGHGREIKAIAAWRGGDLIATGAEDTSLRIWRRRRRHTTRDNTSDTSSLDTDTELECLAIVNKHTAGIQHLQWVSGGGNKTQNQKEQQPLYLVSSSGNEELFLWRIYPTLPGSAYDGLAVVCEAAYTDKTRDGDLRIMGFDVEMIPPSSTQEKDGQVTTLLRLSLVLSNSTLRTYRYTQPDGFTLLAEGRYTGACLMQIRHLHLCSGFDDEEVQHHVVTTSTDGHIALWRTTSTHTTTTTPAKGKGEYTLVETSRLHQSGIKSLDLYPLPSPCSYLLVTGGDDNALGVAYLTLTCSTPTPSPSSSSFTITHRSLVNGAHAAAITGLCCITSSSSSSPDGSVVVDVCTASNDQRVKSWRIHVNDEKKKVRKVALIANRYSSVADCGDLEVFWEDDGQEEEWKRKRVVVAGVGMEVWKV